MMVYSESRAQTKSPFAVVILINLGTPDAPTSKAVRAYLKEFLSDGRVIEIPRFIWQLVLRGMILPFRSRRSAKKYQLIWQKIGSPLKQITAQQQALLQEKLQQTHAHLAVDYAMRYGRPAIQAVLQKWRAKGVQRFLLMPMYPQYAASTTATAFDQVFDLMKQLRHQFELKMVRSYPTHLAYIDALARQIEDFWQVNGRPNFEQGERLLLSFHGLPQRTQQLGDPYYDECMATTRALKKRLLLDDAHCSMSFQSRFGAEKWLQPYTEATVRDWAKQGIRRVDVFCPGFVADCLETLEEVAMEVHDAFLEEGGTQLNAIPCLNTHPAWIDAMVQIMHPHLASWSALDAHNERDDGSR